MVEKFTFADSEAGLLRAMCTTLSLRRAGFTTKLVPTMWGSTLVHVLHATPAARLSRRERGL